MSRWKFILLLAFSLTGHCILAQSSVHDSIDLMTFSDSLLINSKCLFYDAGKTPVPQEKINECPFTPLLGYPFRKSLPPSVINHTFYLKFFIRNPADLPDTVYFLPGYLFTEVESFLATKDNPFQRSTSSKDEDGYMYFHFAPHSSASIIIQMKPCRVLNNSIVPQLIRRSFLGNYKKIMSHKFEALQICGYILSGILLMMILFGATNYFLSRKKEFLYYLVYALCMLIMIFFYAFSYRRTGAIVGFFVSYLDFSLLTLGTIFYIAFTRRFLNTKNQYRVLDKLFKIEEILLGAILLLFSFTHFFTDNFILQYTIESSMKFISLGIGVVYVIIAFTKKDRLMNNLAVGNSALIFFGAISLSMILLEVKMSNLFSSSLFYYEVSIVMAVIFFLLGLTYKNRQELIERTREQLELKRIAETQELEKQLAILKAQQDERNRISADMHDDLGAGMTAIRLYSELAKNKAGDLVLPEINKISSSANELLNKMNAIIWSMNSSNDTLPNLVAYIRIYALEYLENTGVHCRIFLPDEIPPVIVSGELRRNVFLVVKEALNNMLKHAQATELTITLTITREAALLVFQDNGRGINFDSIRQFGNGLKNMKKRMEDVGIQFDIENRNGTMIRLIRPFNPPLSR